MEACNRCALHDERQATAPAEPAAKARRVGPARFAGMQRGGPALLAEPRPIPIDCAALAAGVGHSSITSFAKWVFAQSAAPPLAPGCERPCSHRRDHPRLWRVPLHRPYTRSSVAPSASFASGHRHYQDHHEMAHLVEKDACHRTAQAVLARSVDQPVAD